MTIVSDLYAYFTSCLMVLSSLRGWELHEHGGRRDTASGEARRRCDLSAREPH